MAPRRIQRLVGKSPKCDSPPRQPRPFYRESSSESSEEAPPKSRRQKDKDGEFEPDINEDEAEVDENGETNKSSQDASDSSSDQEAERKLQSIRDKYAINKQRRENPDKPSKKTDVREGILDSASDQEVVWKLEAVNGKYVTEYLPRTPSRNTSVQEGTPDTPSILSSTTERVTELGPDYEKGLFEKAYVSETSPHSATTPLELNSVYENYLFVRVQKRTISQSIRIQRFRGKPFWKKDNFKMGPIKDNASKRKAEDDISQSDIKRLKSSHSNSPDPDKKIPKAGHTIPFPEKPPVIEERNGDIEFRVVNNDNKRESLIILTGLKCIFQKQLPKMPKDYIARLVYDRTHLSMAIVKKPLEVVGGITYRPFKGRQFAEIVFCAISSDQQVKGYGAHLMCHLKDYVKATSDVMHFLTYADNYAIGYFKKQGFTKEITLERSKWMGYIKDYEGGTIMQCTMLPKVRYLEMDRMLLKQKEAVHAKIRAFSKSHQVHQPPKQWKMSKVKIDPMSIEAIRASGWSPDMDELARQPRHGPNYSQLLHLLNDMQNHNSSWPFLNPVSRDDVADYYDVIKEPMDLATMEVKLEADNYATPEDFTRDAKLIFDNCRKYNNETTPYAKSANKLEKYMWQQIKAIPEWSHLEP